MRTLRPLDSLSDGLWLETLEVNRLLSMMQSNQCLTLMGKWLGMKRNDLHPGGINSRVWLPEAKPRETEGEDTATAGTRVV